MGSVGIELDQLVFFVNGQKVTEAHPDPEATLAYFLRDTLGLRGTKVACGQGACGACSVMISKFDRQNNKIHHYAANACLLPLCSLHGMAVTTVEGVGSTRGKLHPIQERLAAFHGTQCGFCSPGMVMSMYALLRNNPKPDRAQIEQALEGNLCRCTGYRPILEGLGTFAKDAPPCGLGSMCCRVKFQNTDNKANDSSKDSSPPGVTLQPYDPSQEPIFPSELQLNDQYDKKSLNFQGPQVTWFRPTTLAELISLRTKYPNAWLAVANTGNYVETKVSGKSPSVVIAPTHVAELNQIKKEKDSVTFGAALTFPRVMEVLQELKKTLPEPRHHSISAVLKMMDQFQPPQIRNVASVGGNIMAGRPISSLIPVLIAAGTKLHFAQKEFGDVDLTADFYKNGKKSNGGILVAFTLPYTFKNEYVCAYTQPFKRHDDRAVVRTGMKVSFKPDSKQVKELKICFGGLGPCIVEATKTVQQLTNKNWDEHLLNLGLDILKQELTMAAGDEGGMEEYRNTLVLSFFLKFHTNVTNCLQNQPVLDPVDEKLHLISGTQVFEEVPKDQLDSDAVGRPLPHSSAQEHATGEAVYIHDVAPLPGELHLAFVLSTKAHAKLIRVDASSALRMPGVHGYFDHSDIPGEKFVPFGMIKDHPVFAIDKVEYAGQIIGAVVADTHQLARRAAHTVKVEYEDLPAILTIEEAIAAKSYLKPVEQKLLEVGNLDQGFKEADYVLEGRSEVGGQEHFYLETHCCLAQPGGEHQEMELLSSTQDPAGVQDVKSKENSCTTITCTKRILQLVSQALLIPANRIQARTKRIGGGFGGKGHQPKFFVVPSALAANRLNRPIRCVLTREEDMKITGGRHPIKANYKVGFTKEGRITALELTFYLNCGFSNDLSIKIGSYVIDKSQSCYKIDNLRSQAWLCKTNQASNTACRGVGGPQSFLIVESIISHIAWKLGISEQQIHQLNMLNEGDTSIKGCKLDNLYLRKCYDQLLQTCNFSQLQEQVQTFNKNNKWKKRGVSLLPVTYGMGRSQFTMQGAVLLNVYTDGSILLTHGGVEMGQGLYSKMIQVASRALGVPVEKIHTAETNTYMVPNSRITCGSCDSFLFGDAVVDACNKLKEKLAPIIKAKPDGNWEQWVQMANFSNVNLSTTGFFVVPDFDGVVTDPMSSFSVYHVSGAGCSEVELDCLTGQVTVLRTDIVMDVGKSLNPAIDIGQIEGAFTQAMGYFMMEDILHGTDGTQLCTGPSSYPMPHVSHIPKQFNVSLLKEAINPRAVYSSKALGEPPFFLGASAFFAARAAVAAQRKDHGVTDWLPVICPGTPEKLRLTCADPLANKVLQKK